MSLDVSLYGPVTEEKRICPHCDSEYVHKSSECYFEANITHNLNTMAGEAGIYQHLWRPEELGITKASELIQPLRAGLILMREDPPRFKKHNPANGWGSYTGFIPWIEDYLRACEEHPEATIDISR